MKTPQRTWLAPLLLLCRSAAMVTLFTLMSSGLSLAVAAKIDLGTGTLGSGMMLLT